MGGIGSFDGDDVNVKGDDGSDDGVKITAIDDSGTKRLAVDVNFQPGAGIPVIPADNLIYREMFFKNGSSKDLNVDGSVTTQYFTVSLAAGETFYLDKVGFLLFDSGNVELTKFGTITALTNGLRLELQKDSVIYEVATMQDNADVLVTITGGANAQGNGGYAPDDAFWGTVDFNKSVTLHGDDGDFIRFVVQDDLSSFDVLRSSLQFWETV